MPTYEYRCETCRHIQEKFVKIPSAKREEVECAHCGGRAAWIFSAGQKPYIALPGSGSVRYADGMGLSR